jgi:micrococcal nuclease
MKLKIFLAILLVAVVCAWFAYQKREGSTIIDEDTVYRVIHVLDGDTFKVKINGQEIIVRMLGINTPETVDPRRPEECFGAKASHETKSILAGNYVRLVLNKNREATDKYGRYLAYVFREDGLNVNEYLLSNGYAREYTYGKPYSEQRNYKRIEKIAQVAGMGLWSACFSEGRPR